MATTTIEAQCNARPTRLAFVLPNDDKDLLRTVIARTTNLWGGMLNPIVILDDSNRVIQGRHHELRMRDPYLELQANVLRAFDPDAVINFGPVDLPTEFKEFEHRTHPASVLDWNPWNRETVSYFVDMGPVLEDVWEKNFKWRQDADLNFRYLNKADAEKSIFLSARFGVYANDGNYELLREHFAAKEITYDAEFKASPWPARFVTPLMVTGHACGGMRQPLHSHAYFLLDPESSYDVVDYWNLRAAGMYVLPLTLNDYREFEQPIRDFGSAASYPINETVTNPVSLIKANSISDDDAHRVTTWIGELGCCNMIATQGWVPRYNMNYEGVGNEVDVEMVKGFEAPALAVMNDGYGVIQGPTPEFLHKRHMLQHWSMDVSLATFNRQDACYRLPWLNAGCDSLVSSRIGRGFGLDASRVSREGIVTYHDGQSGRVSIMPINAEQATSAFLRGCDIEYIGTSGPGLALTRIIEMFDGLREADIFKNVAIRELLDELGTGKTKQASEVRAALHRSLAGLKEYDQPATNEQKGAKVDALLGRAVDAKVFRVGLVFQCSRCKRHNWYAVTEFNENYNCKSCFAREVTPRLDLTKWSYVSDGLFRTTNKLDGNMTILLTLNFFNDLLEYDLKYAPSFDYKCEGESHEMDFAILSVRTFRGPVQMIFGESKSGLALKDNERQKLKRFAEKTRAYICFCTLAEDFDESDKAYFRDIVESKLNVLLLNRFFLEMDHYDFLKLENENYSGRSRSKIDWLMKLTIIRVLGDEFAKKNYIWL